MSNTSTSSSVPRWVYGIGPLVILAFVLAILFITSPFGDTSGVAEASTSEILWMLTIIGFIAGILPVMIGMLWFPFLRSLGKGSIHAILALSAGVLVFIAIEMGDAIVDFGADVDSVTVAAAIAVLAVSTTVIVMEAISRWHHQTVARRHGRGLAVAYIVALGLGAHSIGEGIAIGSAFVLEEIALMTLLVIGFIAHNVTEGPVIVAAVANDAARPPLPHFAAMGVIAGGPVILGGWIGSLAGSAILAVLFFAIGLGAILQVVYEMIRYIRDDFGTVLTRLNAIAFTIGLVGMWLLEDVILGHILI